MRLIDADALMEEYRKIQMASLKMQFVCITEEAIDTAPTIDAVHVVRCKDCKHYAFTDNRVPQERVWWCYYWGYEIGADDYCSNGERKDDD